MAENGKKSNSLQYEHLDQVVGGDYERHPENFGTDYSLCPSCNREMIPNIGANGERTCSLCGAVLPEYTIV